MRQPLEEGINSTRIVLIPKMHPVINMSQFFFFFDTNNMSQLRPISLCNVSFKVIIKIIATRMTEVTPTLVGQTQSSFVLGHYLTDNVFIA